MIIKATNLEKTYKNGVKAVDGLSFEVRDKEILGLLGPNGSGKTTTINSILSLLKADSGTIEIFGQTMSATNYEVKSKIGLITQEVAVFDELTVEENIDYFCGLYISDKQTRKKYVSEAMELVKITEYKKFKPKKLSGGLLRRLHIACGISHKPSLIFFDEPTVGIDPQSRNHILEQIQLLNQQGATIVYTSHYMEEIELLCDYIVIMDHGKVVAEGDKHKLKNLIKLSERVEISLVDDNNLDKIMVDLSKIKGVFEVTNNKLDAIEFQTNLNNAIKMQTVSLQVNKYLNAYRLLYEEDSSLSSDEIIKKIDNIFSNESEAVIPNIDKKDTSGIKFYFNFASYIIF